MARLTAAARKKLPSSDFKGPDRSFPIPDKNHARAALGLINKAPASARPKIRAAADKMLAKGGGGKMTVAQDMKYDKAHGIKEDSAKDKALDKKRGITEAMERKAGYKEAKGGGGVGTASLKTNLNTARNQGPGGVKQSPQVARIVPVTKTPPRPPMPTTSGGKPPTGGSKGSSGKAVMPNYAPRGGGGLPQPGYKGGR